MTFDENDLSTYWEKLQKAKADISNRQKYWQQTCASFLERNLNEVIQKYQIEAVVKHEKRITNMEAIMLDFGRTESGLYEISSPETQRPFIKDFGSLIYSQIYNGKVSVWIRYPVIEGLMDRQAPKVLYLYEPSEITPSHIYSHIKDTLKELAEWEDQDLGRHIIGFNHKVTKEMP